MVQDEVLARLPDVDLRVYVVWEPILPFDSEKAARRSTALIPDPRATHYWTGDRKLGERFEPAIGLEDETAWDVYLVYPPGAVWGEDVPVPVSFQHQLSGRLPREKRLNGPGLEAAIRAAAAGGPAGLGAP